MKLKVNRYNLYYLIVNIIFLNACCTSVFAMNSDIEQPINIESDVQSLNIQRNIATFTGNVIITQGTIKINAAKVVVTRPNGKRGKEIINSYGNPVTFCQMQDNNRPVKGHALQVRYELDKEHLILTGNACLDRFDSNITGDKITYLVKEQKMQAFSEKGKRVTMVLVPSQFNIENKKNF